MRFIFSKEINLRAFEEQIRTRTASKHDYKELAFFFTSVQQVWWQECKKKKQNHECAPCRLTGIPKGEEIRHWQEKKKRGHVWRKAKKFVLKPCQNPLGNQFFQSVVYSSSMLWKSCWYLTSVFSTTLLSNSIREVYDEDARIDIRIWVFAFTNEKFVNCNGNDKK